MKVDSSVNSDKVVGKSSKKVKSESYFQQNFMENWEKVREIMAFLKIQGKVPKSESLMGAHTLGKIGKV